MKNTPKKIRDDQLWKDVYNLVHDVYGQLETMIADFPNEEWTTASKLRNAANDSLFYTAQAVGSVVPESNKYDLNYARKSLFSLQTMYMFAAKQKLLELEPEWVVKIDQILAEIDKRMAESDKADEAKRKEELEQWLEKCRLWQELRD